MKKSDISTVVGLVLGTIAVILGMLNGGSLRMFWDPSSLFITLLGSFCALLISFPSSYIKKLPLTLKNAFIDKSASNDELILNFIELSRKARKNGLLSLEKDLEAIDDNFLKNGMQMVVDGIDPESILEILNLEIDEMIKRHQNGISLLKFWAKLSPAFGAIGALIGMIQMLAGLQNQNQIGWGLAMALITLFYGIILANLVLIPLANKLEIKSELEMDRREMMIEGILGVQSGANPRILEDKLKTFLSPEEKLEFLVKKAAENRVTADE